MTASSRLRADFEGFDLEPGDAALLEEACRTAEELERLSAALTGEPMLVEGSNGQPRPNPLLEEIRRHRTLLEKLLARLRPAEDSAPATVSELASHAAAARWRK